MELDEAQVLKDIKTKLKSDGQYVCRLEEDRAGDIGIVRSLGRRAGRELGWNVRTFATDADRRDDRLVVVFVVVTDSTPLHQELLRVRGDKAVRKSMTEMTLGGDGGHG